MRKLISFMHVSLDGFVAGPAGEMDWIRVDQEIFNHVGERTRKGDTALYGRKTYEMMESYWPTAADQPDASRHDIEHARWYGSIHKIVLSTTMPESGSSNTTVIRGNLAERIQAIKQQAGEEILVFGSPTATHSLIGQDLIDGYWLFVNPVLLGKGIALFKNVADGTRLNLLGTKQFSNGVTELNYFVERR